MKKKASLGSGARFKSLEGKVKKEGYSEEIAKKIAAAAGRKKYGASKMSNLASVGKKRASKKKSD